MACCKEWKANCRQCKIPCRWYIIIEIDIKCNIKKVLEAIWLKEPQHYIFYHYLKLRFLISKVGLESWNPIPSLGTLTANTLSIYGYQCRFLFTKPFHGNPNQKQCIKGKYYTVHGIDSYRLWKMSCVLMFPHVQWHPSTVPCWLSHNCLDWIRKSRYEKGLVVILWDSFDSFGPKCMVVQNILGFFQQTRI